LERPYTNLAETPQKPRRNLPVQKWNNCPQGLTHIREGDNDDDDDDDADADADADDTDDDLLLFLLLVILLLEV